MNGMRFDLHGSDNMLHRETSFEQQHNGHLRPMGSPSEGMQPSSNGIGASLETYPTQPESVTQGRNSVSAAPSTATAAITSNGTNHGVPQKKSSRACDHCRLKKLKCNTEPGQLNCSNCHGRPCEYTRQPLKRGPPKGRKLKRKLEDEEEQSEGDSPESEELKRRMNKNNDRFDPIRDAQVTMMSDAALDPQLRQPQAPLPIPPESKPKSARRTSGQTRRRSENMLPMPPLSLQLEALPVFVEYNQSSLDRWYLLHQTTLPILARDADTLPDYLKVTHPLLRSALLLAIYSVVDRRRTPQRIDALLAERFLLQYTATKVRETTHDRIVHLQVSLILAIEADQRGMQKMPGRCGHTFTHWLAGSISLAMDLRVHSIEPVKQTAAEYWRLRRLYFIMVIMDRWHAIGHAHPLMIPDSQVPFSPTVDLLGPATMHLYTMSMLISKLHARMSLHTAMRDLPDLALLNAKDFKETIDELNAFRTAVEPIWGQSNLLHIGLWHVALLAALSTEEIDIDFVKEHAMRVSAVLPHSATPFTTFNHHFFAMSTLSLFYILGFHEHEEFAIKHLEQLREAITKHKHLALDDDEANWDAQLLTCINAMLDGHPEATRFVTAAHGRADALLAEIRSSGYMRAW
ncbi:hypothetical protein BCR37DRAFT_380294 [Protomyces lactucae-debilis]|uniref:Zn(2)-C6 fungal-type domain-containing protein n=1 Tax=Protomyces lactucae-debilis TaxID=2754530 RepID=A0A1Y2FBV7_PROLT|nr:uncharacterized protein BCR37DRAFT_380294 [Protomyces lactucae-debilis]ORY81398.1 hypothetical protein BCR37DRAFT_380294 [Protomyces lactucae-debilis]